MMGCSLDFSTLVIQKSPVKKVGVTMRAIIPLVKRALARRFI